LLTIYDIIALLQREIAAKTGSELAVELRQEGQKSLDLERRLERVSGCGTTFRSNANQRSTPTF
jgi:chromosome segregation ATPase